MLSLWFLFHGLFKTKCVAWCFIISNMIVGVDPRLKSSIQWMVGQFACSFKWDGQWWRVLHKNPCRWFPLLKSKDPWQLKIPLNSNNSQWPVRDIVHCTWINAHGDIYIMQNFWTLNSICQMSDNLLRSLWSIIWSSWVNRTIDCLYIKNNTDSSTDPCSTPDVTWWHGEDYVPTINDYFLGTACKGGS